MPASSSSLRVFAPAKINLCLHVGERRSDGFHDLESLVAFADVGDELWLEQANDFALEIDGPFAQGLANDANNLVVRAARAMHKAFGDRRAVRIRLTKNLPIASGIGGGSADAAATLRGVVRLWDLAATDSEIRRIAAALGSDVPALPSRWMVLVNPGVAIPTGNVFAALETGRGTGSPDPARFADADVLLEFLAAATNRSEERRVGKECRSRWS